MTIQYLKHDLTKTEAGIVAHGCNCQGKMGSGVALAVKNKWPRVYEKYAQLVGETSNKEELLGLCYIVQAEENNTDLYVANCFTQLYYGYDGKRYADPKAIHQSLMFAASLAAGRKLPLYMHKIGSVRGGLDWETEVLPLVKSVDQYYIEFISEIDIFVCDI